MKMRYIAETALMDDASNAFNSLSLSSCILRKTHIRCPSLAPVLTNTYCSHSRLFTGGGHILSQEETTQGDPLALAMYAISTLPLINKISGEEIQSWYADDASASGKVSDLRRGWDKLQSIGPLLATTPTPARPGSTCSQSSWRSYI